MSDNTAPIDNLSLVVVSFNSAAVLPGCLAGLPQGQKLIVVDNASRDASVEIVRNLAPWATLLVQPHNQGFGPAANLGFAQVTTEFGLLLNADVVPDRALLKQLVAAARAYPEAALLAPTMIDEGKVRHGRRILFQKGSDAGPEIVPEGDFCAPYVGGSAMLFRMEAFRAIGGFDEALFLYYEDDDICLRVRRAGHALVQIHAARLEHLGGASTAGIADLTYWKQWHMAWSRLHMERKHRGRGAMLAYLLREGGTNLLKYLIRPGDKRRARYAGRLAGLVAYAAGRRARDVRLGPANEAAR